MNEDHEYNDLDIEQQNEEAEAEGSQPEAESELATERSIAEIAKLRDIAQRRKRKIEELEKELQKSKLSPKTDDDDELPSHENQGVSREEAYLIAKGFSLEEVEKANKIAKLEGVTLIEASENEMFVAWKKSSDAQRKAEKARLGVSSGSSLRSKEKTFKDSLTDQEHKELWLKKMGRV